MHEKLDVWGELVGVRFTLVGLKTHLAQGLEVPKAKFTVPEKPSIELRVTVTLVVGKSDIIVLTLVELDARLQSGPFDKTRVNVAECVSAEADPVTVME